MTLTLPTGYECVRFPAIQLLSIVVEDTVSAVVILGRFIRASSGLQMFVALQGANSRHQRRVAMARGGSFQCGGQHARVSLCILLGRLGRLPGQDSSGNRLT